MKPAHAWLAAAVLGATFAGLLFFGSLAIAHTAPSGWVYPTSCCSGHDCAPLDPKRVTTADGGYVVDGIHYVPMSDVRVSPDEDYHGCFPTPEKLRCFWAPPRGF